MNKKVGQHTSHQTHHMIPKEVFKKFPILNCIDKDHLDNLINPPTERGRYKGQKGKYFGRSTHNTNHTPYSLAIEDSVMRAAQKAGSCPKKLSQMLGEMQRTIRKELRKGTPMMNKDGASFSQWDKILRNSRF